MNPRGLDNYCSSEPFPGQEEEEMRELEGGSHRRPGGLGRPGIHPQPILGPLNPQRGFKASATCASAGMPG